MRIIRVFPRRTSHTPTDSMAFVGDPPLERPEADEVHVSCAFTWDKVAAERLKLAWEQYYSAVKIGGPAYGCHGGEFTPGLYLRNGITTTSRGCNNVCPWCLVPEREGKLRELKIKQGHIIQDNNILQCSSAHIDKVFDMLRGQSRIEFTGGLEASLITPAIAERLRSLRLNMVFLSCDTENAIKPLRRALKLLQLSPNKARVYVLLKYDPDETILKALIRLMQVWEAGAKPFAQLYQPPEEFIQYSPEWKRFSSAWQRPARSWALMKQILSHVTRGK